MGAPRNQTGTIFLIAIAACAAIILLVLDGGDSSLVLGTSQVTDTATPAPLRPTGRVATGTPLDKQLAQVNPLPKIDLPSVSVPGVSRLEGGGQEAEDSESSEPRMAPGLGAAKGLKPSLDGAIPTPPIVPARSVPKPVAMPRKVEMPTPVSLPPPESSCMSL